MNAAPSLGPSHDRDSEARANALPGEPPAEPAAPAEAPITFRDVAPAMEFSCWVVVALAPFLRWINGPAVTDDQFVIQAVLVLVAATGALGLRLYNWRAARRAPCKTDSIQSHRQ